MKVRYGRYDNVKRWKESKTNKGEKMVDVKKGMRGVKRDVNKIEKKIFGLIILRIKLFLLNTANGIKK